MDVDILHVEGCCCVFEDYLSDWLQVVMFGSFHGS